ncbi:MAG: sigma-54 dependent transcriptional regulator [Terriglobales bacterium]
MKTSVSSARRVLVIDDESQNLELIRAALTQDGLEIFSADGPEEGLGIFAREHPHIVLLDLMMPRMSGMEVLERMVAADPGTNVILMTAHYSTDSAVEAIRKGAYDYLTKPLDVLSLQGRITALLEEAKQRQHTLELELELLKAYEFQGIIGRSPLMLEVFAGVRRVAPHFRNVLVLGATGTGKELVARALHRLSPVASKQLAVCNCSALVETLMESELFGYVRGAFTGATQDKVGLFEYANGGTVFLDEIGDLPLPAQAKLLRVLQNQEVQRVGSPAARKIDVRVIAATHRDLRALVKEGQFREDLYYRLSMVELHLPRLRDRKEDFPLLLRHFTQKFAAAYNKPIRGITRRAQALLARYSWPGNVRELENVLGNACMMVAGSVIDANDLPSYLSAGTALPQQDGLLTLEEIQKRHVLHVLEQVGNNKARAAEILDISRATLYSFLAKSESEAKAAKASR